MKVKISLIVACLFGLFSFAPDSIQAHTAGQPPFFKINGTYTSIYPVPGVSVDGIDIPQDLAPSPYLINQKLIFEIDWQVLGIAKEAVELTDLIWDYGDGTKITTKNASHIYKTPGSYVQKVFVKTANIPQPQLLQSTMVNVLPNKNFQIPISKINIQTPPVITSKTNISYFDLEKPLTFSAQVDDPQKVITYTWDFGDGSSSTGQTVTHTYPLIKGGLSIVSAVLRTKNSAGFISDSYVVIYDKSLATTSPQPQPKTSKPSEDGKLVYLIPIVLLTLMSALIWQRKSKKAAR